MPPEIAAPDPIRSIYRRVRSNDFFRHGFLVLAATMVLNVAAFLFHAVVSRKLGVSAYGSLYAIVSLALFASFPAGIFNTVISKIAAELRALDDPAHLRALTLAVCRFFGATVLVYLAAGLLLAAAIGDFMHIPSPQIVLAVAMGGCLVFVLALRAIAQGVQDFKALSASLVMDGVLKCTLGAGLADARFGIAGGLFGFFAGSVLSGAFTLWRLWEQFRTADRTAFRIDLRRVFSTTVGATALNASIAILSYADVLVVQHFFAPHEAGIYAATSLSGKILFFLVAFAPMVIIPKAVDSHSRGKNPLIALRASMLMVLALSGAGLLAFVFGGNIILRLLVGGGFSEAAPLLPWYGLAMSLLAIANVLASYSIALHRFSFSVPLIVAAFAEISAIFFYHPDLQRVVFFLVLGNALAFIAVAVPLALRRGSNLATGD